MIKIVITGPESTGKTTLAKQLARELKANRVPEFARQYIDNLERPYVYEDLVDIANGQLKLEDGLSNKETQLLFCDTDLITIKIWSEVKFGKVERSIVEMIKRRRYDFYLLCRPDLPWEYDPQRESEGQLEELFERYKRELIFFNKTFFEVYGTGQERLKNALDVIQKKIPTLI